MIGDGGTSGKYGRNHFVRGENEMHKSYSEQLGKWVGQRKLPMRDKNLAAFRAVLDDVKAALNDGYRVKTIWTNMHEAGRIEFAYHTFRNYVKKHVVAPDGDLGVQPQARPRAQPYRAKQGQLAAKPVAQNKESERSSGFTFNPAPNKEELL